MNAIAKDWFVIENINELSSPGLVIFRERIIQNIQFLISRVKDINVLRPHVKTNKIAEVCQLMQDAGISKFKCATIAEAEMLGMIKAPDVLLAHQPVGPQIQRLIRLIKASPATNFSCIIDDADNAELLNNTCAVDNIRLTIFIDVNTGMNRSGIVPQKVLQLFRHCLTLRNVNPVGLHVYDGHITDADSTVRQQKSNTGFDAVNLLSQQIEDELQVKPVIVIGGSPSFATHLLRNNVEYSPGTFVFWDWGYKHLLPDEPYQYAALVISRVISIVNENTICADLGHKAVAAENPLPRVHFLNAPDAVPVGQSEEHLVLKVPDASAYKLGDVLYGVPVHICPTVALYQAAAVIENGKAVAEWQVIARNRKITV